MIKADSASSVMTTADGIPLRVSLQRAMRRAKLRALLLVAPLFIFIFVTFFLPILDMSLRAVENPQVMTIMPKTVDALRDWDETSGELPDEAAFAALVSDLKEGRRTREIGKVATRLNYESSGMRSLLNKTSRRVLKLAEGPFQEAVLALDKQWGELETWQLIKREGEPYTFSYLLAAADLKFAPDGRVERQPDYQRIYVSLFWRTLWMSLLITFLCLLLGFPIAHMLAVLPARHSNMLMILVLLPFWTSLLVRTSAWIVVLQTEGVLNDLLAWIGVIADDDRPQMIFNRTGTIVAMVHILLPFMVLPLYSVMKTIPPNYMRAARSLGANQWMAFWRVYMPQTLPGIGAGSILVFILAIGYYITPALVGGQSGQLISNMIAFHMQKSLNWGLAAAIGAILLIAVLGLYLLYNRLVGVDKMKLG